MPDENQKPENPTQQPVEQAPEATPTTVGSQRVIQPSQSFVQEIQAQPQPVQPTVATTEPTPTITPPSQVAGMVNGQAFAASPMSSSQLGQLSEQKPSKWRYFFIVLGVLQALGVAMFFGIMSSIAGQTGGEFVALLLFVTLVPAVGLIALINLIGLPIYMRKNKPHGKGLVFSIISLVISVILALYGAYSVYQMRVAVPKHINELSEQSRQKSEQRQQEFATANAKPEITKEEAIQLLKTCKLKGFYYTNQTDKSDPANGGWGELSSTGVVLTKVDGQPYRISIADKLIPELVPIAREAQKTCGGPQFWHDGTYEQYKDGKWYFKGEVVNSSQSGKTKEQAISFMQSCKADYFVGYKDINLVKDSNTRSWLDKAEKSTTGIEISEGSPKSYVFASKAMTTALQDTARQFRQSCYNTKKLYITVDNWIETEYPAGKWTRVNQ